MRPADASLVGGRADLRVGAFESLIDLLNIVECPRTKDLRH